MKWCWATAVRCGVLFFFSFLGSARGKKEVLDCVGHKKNALSCHRQRSQDFLRTITRVARELHCAYRTSVGREESGTLRNSAGAVTAGRTQNKKCSKQFLMMKISVEKCCDQARPGGFKKKLFQSAVVHEVFARSSRYEQRGAAE